jgi:hypothetical protein
MSKRLALFVLLCIVVVTGSLSAQEATPATTHFDILRATIGVDDGVLARGTSAIFKVYLDDKEVFDAGVVRPGEDPRSVEIALGDAKKLMLEVADTGDGHGGDWGNWCDARLESSQTGDMIFLSDMAEKVVSEWIDTKKDRNIINEPIKLKKRVYCKGLGTISGSKMEYSGWNELAAQREAERAAYDSLPLRLRGIIPDGVTVTIGETEYSYQRGPIDVAIEPGDKVIISLVGQEGESLFNHPAFERMSLASGDVSVSLRDCIPWRIVHHAPDDGEAPILLGKPYWGASGTGEKADLVYERWNLASAVKTAAGQTAQGSYSLKGVVGVQKGKEDRFATVVFRVLSGDSVALPDTLIAGSNSRPVTFPVDPQAPLTLEVGDMGDGDYGDDALWADVTLVNEQTGDEYRLSDFDPWSAKVGWERLGVNNNSTGGQMQIGREKFFSGFGASARSEIVFKDLLPAIEAMRSAAAKVTEAQAAIGDAEAAGRLLEEAKKLDDKNPDIYLTLAEIAVKQNDTQAELAALKRLVEISRADVPQRRRAKQRIDEIYSEIGISKQPALERLPSSTPRDDHDVLDLAKQGICSVTIGAEVPDDSPDLLLPGIVSFHVRGSKTPFEAVVDSRGTEMSLEIRAIKHAPGLLDRTLRAPVVASTEPKAFPTIRADLDPGEYTLLIWHDGNKDKIERDFDVPVAFDVNDAALVVPEEEWNYTIALDGNARAEGKIQGADVIQIPLTAENVRVEGADYTLTYPEFEYCSKIGTRESMIMTLAPHGAGECTVTYDWPDGAYNVPMSRYADDRRERFYFRTPVCLNEDVEKLPVHVTVPEGTGKLERLVPETLELSASKVERTEEQIKAEEGKKDYELKHPAVMPDSESVSIDGKPVKRGDDYTLESWSGTLKLNEAPPKEAALAVSYEYVPEGIARTYSFELDWDKPVTMHALNEKLESAWLVETHNAMRVFIPEADYYRAWFPEYMALLQRIYDAESKALGGYEPDDEILVSLTGPAQLSGYGGATWGGPLSESWIASTGRVGEYNLRCEPGGDGVEAHELKWVFLHGIGGASSAPHWLRSGAVIWIEEQGKMAGDTAFADIWSYGTLTKQACQYLESYPGKAPCLLQLSEDEFNKLNHAERDLGSAMCWYIHDFLAHKYGQDFWGKFYKLQRDNPARYKILDPRSKDIQVVEDIVKTSGDESVRRQFIEWGFDLTPDPEYAPQACVLFPAYWRFSPGDDPAWSNPAFDDSDWGKIAIGGVWEDNDEYKGLDGYAWYRLRFTIPESFEPSDTLELSLGKIDDADEVFLNGEKVGQTGKFPPDYESGYEEQRRYDVPKDLVKVGQENVLAVRVYDGGGGGGLTGEGFWLRRR